MLPEEAWIADHQRRRFNELVDVFDRPQPLEVMARLGEIQLVKEIDSDRLERQRIERELERMESDDDGLRQRWAGEWHTLGSAPLSPSEMKEWMQARKAILDRLQQAREKENDHHLLQERASNAAALSLDRLARFASDQGTVDSIGEDISCAA